MVLSFLLQSYDHTIIIFVAGAQWEKLLLSVVALSMFLGFSPAEHHHLLLLLLTTAATSTTATNYCLYLRSF